MAESPVSAGEHGEQAESRPYYDYKETEYLNFRGKGEVFMKRKKNAGVKIVAGAFLALFCAFSNGFAHECPEIEKNQMRGQAFNQNKKDFIPFHGKRHGFNADFSVLRVYMENLNSGKKAVTVVFSSPIDPRSVTEEKIKVNGRKISEREIIKFNRAGNAMRIVFLPDSADRKKYSLELSDISSFDGKMLESCICEDIESLDFAESGESVGKSAKN